MADQDCSLVIKSESITTEQEVSASLNDVIVSNVKIESPDSNICPDDSSHINTLTNSSGSVGVKVEEMGDVANSDDATTSTSVVCDSTELQPRNVKVEEDENDDFLAEDFMDNLSVVDSWNDASDLEGTGNANVEEGEPLSSSQAQGIVSQKNQIIEPKLPNTQNPKGENISRNESIHSVNVDKNNDKSRRKSSTDNLKPSSRDVRVSEKNYSEATKTRNVNRAGKDLSSDSRSRNRQSDRKERSPNNKLGREQESRHSRSRDQSNKSADIERSSRRNLDRVKDRNYTSQRSSRYSRTGSDRDHNTSKRRDASDSHASHTDSKPRRGHSPQSSRQSIRTNSGKKRSSVNVSSGPLVEKLVPPGTEDEVQTVDASVKEKEQSTPQADTLVPPGTEEVLLPEVTETSEQNASLPRKRKVSTSVNQKNAKSGLQRESSVNDKDKQVKNKRRRITTEKKEPAKKIPPLLKELELTGREKITRDQERISRELSLERLRESRINRRMNRGSRDRYRGEDRERFDREISPGLDRRTRHSQMFYHKLREEDDMFGRERRSLSYDRREAIGDARWDTFSRDHYDRRYLDLSPVSVGRLSPSPPFSFDFSPVSSRSSSRERCRRNKFRSYSPISSGSEMGPSDEERGFRSRRRRRLPFLDEMERKLGLKLTGGHTLNQKLRASQPPPFHGGVNIDQNAPPPGTYPVMYPENHPNPYPNTVYSSPSFVPIPPLGVERYEAPSRTNLPPPVQPPLRQPPPIRPPPVQPTPVQIPPSITRPPLNEAARKRQLVALPRAPQNVTFRFRRSLREDPSGVPVAPPPPTISDGRIAEMSLSSLLEASVKGSLEAQEKRTNLGAKSGESVGVGSKNPVDSARVQRCQVAIQALQEDESFNLISSGRFVVQPSPQKSYKPAARFDHPAQESLFLLKSPLLRKQRIELSFTTPPAVPFRIEASKRKVSPRPLKSSIWPKNSERIVEKKVPSAIDTVESDGAGGDTDVWIVEKKQTVFSISSDGSDGEMDLSLVSDNSDVCDDEVDKLENVSSSEDDDFTQCATCAERGREKETANASTQSNTTDTRSVSVQVDAVGFQLRGSCIPDLEYDDRWRPASGRTNDLPVVNNAASSTVTGSSSNSSSAPFATSLGSNRAKSPNKVPSNPSFSNTFNPSLPSSSSSYQQPTSSVKKFSNDGNLGPSSLGAFRSNEVNTTAPTPTPTPTPTPNPTPNYKSSGPFTTHTSRMYPSSVGIVGNTQTVPTKGILKPSRPAEPTPNVPAAINFQASKFQPSLAFQSTGIGLPQRQPLYTGNQTNQNQQGLRAQPFQSPMSQTSIQPQAMTTNFGNSGNFGSSNSYNSSNILGSNTNFGNFSSIGALGTVASMAPAPNPVPIPTHNPQQNYPGPPGGLGISSVPSGMTRDQYQNYFDGLTSNQSKNYYQPGQY